jgi:hypothetical protein
MRKSFNLLRILFFLAPLSLSTCATTEIYRDPNMDFGSIQTIAAMPFLNLSRDNIAGERVRDVFINKLLATGAVYVLPIGEVARGIARSEIQNPAAPSQEEVVKLSGIIKAQAVVTGVVKEYGEVRSGTSSSNVISISLQMMEGTQGKVVWTASTTQGGITIWDRLFGGGGRPMNDITDKAVDDLMNKLFSGQGAAPEEKAPQEAPSKEEKAPKEKTPKEKTPKGAAPGEKQP